MLDERQRDLLQDLFAQGAELPDGERAAFVQRTCGDDLALRQELSELLGVAASRIERFMVEPFLDIAASDSQELRALAQSAAPEGEPPPELENYADLQQIAVGGMGTVYRARQIRPVQRIVAIKAIRAGLSSHAVLARFERERQVLALMSHPYIAAVHDAGLDARGRPFLAMEYVEGRPITEACDAARLGLDERLALFVKVCGAVDHAHRQGVLHRDLKPSNVLVSKSGEEWIPKVIDFGIAKALEQPLDERTLLTEAGAFVGTPEYMSPEQFGGFGAAVDTRSDVYALGVLLYELIACSLPFDSRRLREAGLLQIGTILREEMPPKPSTRARKLATTKQGVRTEVQELHRWLQRLPGDPDWIVMKALEKEPERRYRSPHDLADDVVRFLEHRPVSAGPPSKIYRVRKFVRRFRVQVIAAFLVLASLVLGLLGTTWYLFEARTNAEAADARAREALAARREAEGIRIATDAAMLADESPNLALLLAIEASKLTSDDAVNRTIHQVLPKHHLLASIEAHDHDIRELHFLRDGRLVSRPYDAVLLITDPDTGAVLHRLAGHTDVILDLDIHPAGRRILSASMDGTVRIWDADTGSCVLRTPAHSHGFHAGAFSPDGEHFAAAAADGTIRLFDLRSGAAREVFESGGTRGASLSFAPGSARIVTSALDGPVRIWSTRDGSLERELPRSRFGDPDRLLIFECRWSPRGDRVLVGTRLENNPHHLHVLDLGGQAIAEHRGVLFAGFLAENRVLAGGASDWSVFDLETGAQLEKHAVDGRLLESSPDESWGFGVDAQRDLCVMDLDLEDPLAPGTQRKLLGESDKRWEFLDLAVHPDGQRFAICGSRVRIWAKHPEYAPFDLPGVPEELLVVSLVAAEQALVLLRRGETTHPTWELWSVDERCRRSAFSSQGIEDLWIAPDGTRLVGTSWSPTQTDAPRSPRLVILDLDGRVLCEKELEPGFRYVARPDGQAVMQIENAGHDGARGRVIDLETQQVIAQHPIPSAAMHWVGESSSSYLLYVYGVRSRTDAIEVATGKPLVSVRGPNHLPHYGHGLTQDARYLLTILGNMTARVYDLTQRAPDGAPRLTANYTDLVRSNNYSGGFLANGTLAWAMCSNEVHVFESATGKPFTVLALDSDCIAVAGRADASEFLTVTRSGRVQRWPLDPVTVAKRMAVGQLTRRQLDQFEIGTPEQRRTREIEGLLAVPKVRNLARLAEIALEDGELDRAIELQLAAISLGPLAPQDRLRYLKLLELLCLRLGRTPLDAERRSADLEAALEALRESVRCGVSRDELLALPGIEALMDWSPFFALIPPSSSTSSR
ncbi:MAG: protein kinase [Planctomycetes bacterium]|nr:protein kinase [Planctomycetota bacterium]